MITKGSKIKLAKPMGEFDNVGEVCDVVKVTEEGVISFKFGNGKHLGCMSYDEYGKYFVDYVEPKNGWSDWKSDDVEFINCYGDRLVYESEYRSNGEKVQVKCTEGLYSGLMGEAACSKSDKFDFDDGYALALSRLLVKIAERNVDILIEEM